MQPAMAHARLRCDSCHEPHGYDTRRAAVEACLQCHADDHSRAYRDSEHFALWRRETLEGGAAGSGVSCATCHMPVLTEGTGEEERRIVQHNQNANLRPNEKMIRTVCLDCHGFGFSLDALADRELVQRNFQGGPSRHVESLDLVLRRRAENNPNPSTAP
jgi:hypothetical protein